MKIEGVCAHCDKRVSVLIHLPTTWSELEGAMIGAHDAVSPACSDSWILDGLHAAPVTSTAASPNTCRHAANCGCYLRCQCGWLVVSGGACTNPTHGAK